MRKADPVAETITDIEMFDSTQSLVNGIAGVYKNKILFVGYRAADDLKLNYFDVTDNSTGTIGSNFAYSNSCKGFLAPDGCFYLPEGSAGWLHRFDIEAGTSTNLAVQVQAITCLSSDGYMYSLESSNASDISTYKKVKLFDVPIDPNFLCNRYLNTT